jgi:AraC family transcriptional regulator
MSTLSVSVALMITKLPPGTFFGQTQCGLDVSGLKFAESTYLAGSDIPMHVHANAFFYFVIDGLCEEVYGRKTRSCGPSTLVFHPPGAPHSNRWHGSDGRVLHIEISGARAESISEHTSILDSPAEFRSGPAPWLARRLYLEYHRTDGVSSLAMEGLALEILAEMSRRSDHDPFRTPPRWLFQTIELLRDRFSENLSLGEIARTVGIHPVHLARVFRKHYGCTLGDHVRRLRVEFACQQLATSDAPLISIAHAAGFSDQSHFNRTFKQSMRMTPGQFRENFRSR